MKRKIKLTLFFVLLFVFNAKSFSQSSSFESVCSQLALNKITKGNFVQTKTFNSAKGKRELKSSGEFIFSLEGIMWKTEKPFPQTMIVKKDCIIQIAKDGSKKITDTSDNKTFESVAETLMSVFSNNYSQIVKLFEVTYSEKNNSQWEAVLVPKDKTIASVMASLTLSGTNIVIDTIVMNEAAGNTTSYAFEKQIYPQELSQDENKLFSEK